jgi:hypothetical protein
MSQSRRLIDGSRSFDLGLATYAVRLSSEKLLVLWSNDLELRLVPR